MTILVNEIQKAVINCNNYLLITGGPGSGKTTVAILKAKQEIKKLDEFQKILFLSFSNSAVHQIRKSSNINLNKDELQKIEINTFHSFCFSILKSYGGIAGIKKPVKIFRPEDEATIASRYRYTNKEKEKYLLGSALEDGKICFDLFSVLAFKLMERSRVLLSIFQSCYPIIIVDEFQDTGMHQWALIKLLGEQSRLICLADPFQRIYDFRPEVSRERLKDYRNKFCPKTINFNNVNYRSGGNEILDFANSIIERKKFNYMKHILFLSYKWPNQVGFSLKSEIKNMQRKLIKKDSVLNPKLCVFTRTNDTALFLSSCLIKKTSRANYSLNHDILLNENKLVFSQRFICTLLENIGSDISIYLKSLLDELISLHFSYNNKTHTNIAQKLSNWKEDINKGKIPRRSKICHFLKKIHNDISNNLKGNVIIDFENIKKRLSSQQNDSLKPIIENIEKCNLFKKGSKIATQANELYFKNGNYSGLKKVFLKLSIESKIYDFYQYNNNVTIMTMHKSKGREFDGVIIFDGQYNHSINLREDDPNLSRTRTLVRVAITRARHYVSILYQDNHFPVIFDN